MGTNITHKPPLPIPASVSASSLSPASSNIKIERVLSSSSVSAKPFLQAAPVQDLLHSSNPASTPASAVVATTPRHLPAPPSASTGANTTTTPAIASVHSLLHPDSASSPIQQHQHQYLHQHQQLQLQHQQQQLKQENQEPLPPQQQQQLQPHSQPSQQPLLLDSPPSSSESSMATAVVAPQPAHVMQPFTRPIRFVANDGQPHAKRRRISAAHAARGKPAVAVRNLSVRPVVKTAIHA
ncbi:hypothetical protein HOY80DRAFT_379142 [Tuber brumale]|nr:hypothetical protein HOY80DRAFT_379142 [Tuber brumale]